MKASIPLDTFVLAALILQRLKPKFFDEWCDVMTKCQRSVYEEERTKEVIVVAAVVGFILPT